MKSRKSILGLSSGMLLVTLSFGGLSAQETPPEPVQQVMPSAVAHDTAGKEACMVCHAIGASPVLDVPADHDGRADKTCMWCHAADSPMLTVQPSNTPHGRADSETDCMRCHGPEADPEVISVPESHADRTIEGCMWCHVKVERGGGSS